MNNTTLSTDTTCASTVCRNAECPNLVGYEARNGRFYVTMGHAGFNLPTNNQNGYATENAARRASAKLLPTKAETFVRHRDGLLWFAA